MIGLGSERNLLDKNENAGQLCVCCEKWGQGFSGNIGKARQRQAIAGGAG